MDYTKIGLGRDMYPAHFHLFSTRAFDLLIVVNKWERAYC